MQIKRASICLRLVLEVVTRGKTHTLIHTRLGRFMRVRASHIAFIDYIEQYYRKKVEETGREW